VQQWSSLQPFATELDHQLDVGLLQGYSHLSQAGRKSTSGRKGLNSARKMCFPFAITKKGKRLNVDQSLTSDDDSEWERKVKEYFYELIMVVHQRNQAAKGDPEWLNARDLESQTTLVSRLGALVNNPPPTNFPPDLMNKVSGYTVRELLGKC
jgi:hypothetical protein